MELKHWTTLQMRVVKAIQSGLSEFLNKISIMLYWHLPLAWATSSHHSTVTVAMNYANYKDNIVQAHKVKIISWGQPV